MTMTIKKGHIIMSNLMVALINVNFSGCRFVCFWIILLASLIPFLIVINHQIYTILRNVQKLNFTKISTDTQRKIDEVLIDPSDSAKFQKDIYEVCLQCKNICGDAADGQRISQHHRRLATIFDKKRIRKYLLWIQLTGLHLVPAKMLISRVVERM